MTSRRNGKSARAPAPPLCVVRRPSTKERRRRRRSGSSARTGTRTRTRARKLTAASEDDGGGGNIYVASPTANAVQLKSVVTRVHLKRRRGGVFELREAIQ